MDEALDQFEVSLWKREWDHYLSIYDAFGKKGEEKMTV